MPPKAKVREAASAKLKDGLPRKAYAYAPTADPSTWKLPYLTASGAPDPDHLPGAAAALSEGGFRGSKADIPTASMAMVKSKLRQAYRKWKGSDAEYPEGIREVEAGQSIAMAVKESEDETGGIGIREATILLDRTTVSAQVIAAPNGDMLVIPNWTGAFTELVKAYSPVTAEPSWSASYDAEDAAGIVSSLIRLKRGEADEPEQVAMLDTAINALLKFIPAEADEMTVAAEATCTMCSDPVDCDCTTCPCVAHGNVAEAEVARLIGTLIREAGRRNNSKDQKMVQSIHDMTHDLGAEHDTAQRAKFGEAAAAFAEADIAMDPAAAPENVTFRESGLEYVTLAESSPVFDDDAKEVWITPIKPGFGNKKTNFYYPAATLREATQAGMFTGLKMFRNHPRKSEEKDLPERSVTDWFAVTKESAWDEASATPRVKVKVFEDADWNRFKAAPEQVAFSVLGGGTVREGTVAGAKAKVIESLTSLRSVDWVTNAGAGGAIQFAESASEEFEMDPKDMTVAQVEALKESNPEVYAHLVGLSKAMAATSAGEAPAAAGAPTADVPAVEPKTEPVAAPETPAAAEAPKVEPVKESGDEPVNISEAETQTLIRELLAERKVARTEKALAEATAEAQKVVKAVLKETTLPKVATDAIEEKFAEAAMGNGYIYADEKGLRAALDKEVRVTGNLLQSVGRYTPRVSVPAGAPEPGTEQATVRESVEKRMAAKWGTEVIPQPDPTVVWAGKHVEDEGTTVKESAVAANISEAAQPVSDRIAKKWGNGGAPISTN